MMHKRSNRINALSILFAIVLSTVFSSCTSTLFVAPKQVDCTGVSEQKCYLVRSTTDGNWILHYDDIEGLEYEPGFSYKLKVKRENVKNPPLDGSSLRYTLVELVEKRDVTDDIEVEDLAGKEWKLVSLKSGGTSYGIEDKVPTINFETDGKIKGNGGCNNYFGNFSLDGRTLSFSDIGSTRMACEETMDLEGAFLKVLENELRALFSEGQLLLSADGGNQMIFSYQ